MKIVALTKTLTGDCWAVASLESIYDFCEKIVYVHAHTSWRGETQKNEVVEVIESWKKEHDSADKIVNLHSDGKEQEKQYDEGERWIAEHCPDYDAIMLVDTDEVWDDAGLKAAVAGMEASFASAYRVRLHTYVKSPYYRVDPTVGLWPMTFVRRGNKLRGVRGSEVRPCVDLPNVFFHHFTSVRKSLSDTWKKHANSCHTENQPIVEYEEWVREKWNRLPDAKNILPLKNYSDMWKRVVVVKDEDLPPAALRTAVVKAWKRYPAPVLRPPAKPVGVGVVGAVQQKKITVSVAAPPAARQHPGTLAVFTVVDAAYAPLLPLWAMCARRACPDCDLHVITRNCDAPAGVAATCVRRDDDLLNDGRVAASLRFLIGDDALTKYDYCLITDADILMYPETVHIADQHVSAMILDDTGCYENWLLECVGADPRLLGVHFVTKEWWGPTAAARHYELDALEMLNGPAYNYDEVMLGRIVRDSRLRLPPPKLKMWRHHGIHLGPLRRTKNTTYRLSAHESLLLSWLLHDEAAKDAVEKAVLALPDLRRLFGVWRTALK